MATDTEIVDWLDDRIICAYSNEPGVVEFHLNDRKATLKTILSKGAWDLRVAISKVLEQEKK